MNDMQLDYDESPSTTAASSGGGRTASALAAERPTTSTSTSTSLKTTGEASNMDKATTSNDVTAKEPNPASRILDELLGDMLSIVEDSCTCSEGEDDNDEETNDSWSTSSSSSSATSDTEQSTHKDTLKVPTSSNAKGDSDKEEGELESDHDHEHEHEARRLKEAEQQKKRIQHEERAKKREEKKKLSIERNVSERDVYRYLKHRGFPPQFLAEYTKYTLSKSHPHISFASTSTSTDASTSGTSNTSTSITTAASVSTSDLAVSKPTKQELTLLSSKHSYKRSILEKSKKLNESKDVVGRLLENCMRIVAEEEARSAAAAHAARVASEQQQHASTASSRKGKEREGSVGASASSAGAGARKGNYTGRKKMVDKSVETDASLLQSTATSSGATADTTAKDPAKALEVPRRNTRPPTPTSPPSRFATTLPPSSAAGASSGAAPAVSSARATPGSSVTSSTSSSANKERAAKAAQLASRFQYVLKSEHLNYNKKDLENFQGGVRSGLGGNAGSTTAPSASISGGGGLAASTSSLAAPGSADQRRELPNGPRASIHPALNDIASDTIGSKTSETVKPVGHVASHERTNSTDTSRQQQQQTNPQSSSSVGVAPSASSIAASTSMTNHDAPPQRKTSIYDMVPEYIVQKKKSSQLKTTALPSANDSMDVDTAPVAGASAAMRSSSSTEGPESGNRPPSHSPVTQMSIGLPAADKGKGKSSEKNASKATARKEDVGHWFGSSMEPDSGTVYSPIEMEEDAPPPPPSESAPSAPPPPPQTHSLPAKPVTSASETNAGVNTAFSNTMRRPIRTSMSPPPPLRARQGSAGSPPPTASTTSSLPLPPSHLPSRPLALPTPAPTDPKVLKNMFLSSSNKSSSSLSGPAKKAQQYNPIQSTNEPLPLPQREIKSIDPRKLAAEKAKMLREERESESDRAGSPTLPTSTSTSNFRSGPSSSTINMNSGRTASLQAQKDVQESSASPDILPPARDPEKANSPPMPSRAQQAANTTLPLPSFRKAGQANENITSASTSAAATGKHTEQEKTSVNTDQREAELRNKLKRNREETGAAALSTSNKRPARESIATAANKGKSSESDSGTAKDTSPPPPSASKKNANVKAAASASASTMSNTPTSARRLVNSQGKRVSDLARPHDVSDVSDEEGAVSVDASRNMDKAVTSKRKAGPVVEVSTSAANRQGSVASSIGEESVASSVGKSRKKVVARKSTGGPKKLVPSTSTVPAPAPVPASSQAAPATADTPKEPIKLKFTMGGGKPSTVSSTSQSASTSSRPASYGTANASSIPASSQPARQVIEIDDTSDEDDDDDIPLRKPPATVKKPSVPSSSATSAPAAATPRSSAATAAPAATPPSSANKQRPRAKPLVGSGKRFSDIGMDIEDVEMRERSPSTEDDRNIPSSSQRKLAPLASAALSQKEAPSQHAKKTMEVGTKSNSTSSPAPAKSASPKVAPVSNAKPATPPKASDELASPPMLQEKITLSAAEEQEEDETISGSESEAYSPSQMPRYSLSPIPDESLSQLPTASTSQAVVAPQSAALLQAPAVKAPAVKMTQVASSQSPEESQALRSGSDAAFDDDIDMLASDTEDNALAEDLLKHTLDDLPDLAPPSASIVQSTTFTVEQASDSTSETMVEVKESTSTMITAEDKVTEITRQVESTTQRTFEDPMDLSQAFGHDDEDGEGESMGGNVITSGESADRAMQLERNLQKESKQAREMASNRENALSPENLSQSATISTTSRLHESLDRQDAAIPRTTAQHPARSTAADFMASQDVAFRATETTASTRSFDRTPVLSSAALPAQVSASSHGSASHRAMYTSPMVAVSEAESFEIIMNGQSPTMQSFLPTTDSTSGALDAGTKPDLSALDRPLEEPFTKCRYGTGCLDMNCPFAHQSPSLTGAQSRISPYPTLRTPCGDGVWCKSFDCPYSHPSPAARRKEACPNQANCPYGAKCIFKHVEQGNSQLVQRYNSYNQSTRFNNPSFTSAPQQQGYPRQQSSPPPSVIPGMTTTRLGSQVTTTTFPFYSHHPMPAMPAGTPPLSRSASPSVATSTSSHATGSSMPAAGTSTSGAASLYPSTFHYQQQNQSSQSQNRSWTNGARGWLANLAGLSKPNQDV